jgi:hypothetical protein
VAGSEANLVPKMFTITESASNGHSDADSRIVCKVLRLGIDGDTPRSGLGADQQVTR